MRYPKNFQLKTTFLANLKRWYTMFLFDIDADLVDIMPDVYASWCTTNSKLSCSTQHLQHLWPLHDINIFQPIVWTLSPISSSTQCPLSCSTQYLRHLCTLHLCRGYKCVHLWCVPNFQDQVDDVCILPKVSVSPFSSALTGIPQTMVA
jgi:hypothetical protein